MQNDKLSVVAETYTHTKLLTHRVLRGATTFTLRNQAYNCVETAVEFCVNRVCHRSVTDALFRGNYTK